MENNTVRYAFLTVIAIGLAILFIVLSVQGVPTTNAVTNITNGGVTFNAAGAGSTGFFKWGSTNGTSYKWTTPNMSYSGTFSDYWVGSPLLANHTYYAVACDNTGCGNQVIFTTGAANITNATSYGTRFVTLLHSGFNTTQMLGILVAPYSTSIPGGAPVTWGLLFFFVIAGFWLRHRDITIPCFLAMISGGVFWLGSAALGVPSEFAMVGQGLMYAAIAGMAVGWFSK